MDIVAVGYPSPLATWAFQFLEAALREVAPELSVLRLDRFDSVTDLGSHPGTRLILSQFPNPRFAEACEENKVRSAVFADDIIEAVQYVRAAHGISTLEALRPVSAGLVLAGPFARSPLGLTIRRDTNVATADLLLALLEYFGLKLSDERATMICQKLGQDHPTLEDALRHSNPPPAELSADDRTMVFQVLGGLREHLQQPRPGDVTWSRFCFLTADRADSAAPLALEVTGRARIIYYGPYFHLPQGAWTARVSVGFSQDIRGVPFSIEAHSVNLLGRARIFADRGGIFSFEFEAVVTAAHEPIEVRVMSEQGAIEGHIGLVGIDFVQWRPHPTDVPAPVGQHVG